MHFKIQFFAALLMASFKASSGSKLISGISTGGGLSGGVHADTGTALERASVSAQMIAANFLLFLFMFDSSYSPIAIQVYSFPLTIFVTSAPFFGVYVTSPPFIAIVPVDVDDVFKYWL